MRAKLPTKPPHHASTPLPFRLHPGMVVDGYRLGHQLGRGVLLRKSWKRLVQTLLLTLEVQA